MPNSRAKITYLFHSGFSVETASHFFIFDYYRPAGLDAKQKGGKITAQDLKNKSNIYIFSSHSHADHFDPVILTWAKEISNIRYIFSDDITLKAARNNCRFMAPYQTISDETVEIKTFGSTDLGLSFLVKADGLSIFHAGDLNWWHWKGESPSEQKYASTAFKSEIEKISGQSIDLAFFPVDRRLEEFYSLGAEYFLEKMKPKLLIPMHFGEDFAASKNFAAKLQDGPFKTVIIDHLGQETTY